MNSWESLSRSFKKWSAVFLIMASAGNVLPTPAASFDRLSSKNSYDFSSDRYVEFEDFLLSFSTEVHFDCEELPCGDIQKLQEESDVVFKLRDFSSVYIFVDLSGASVRKISLATINQILHSVSIGDGKIEITFHRSKLDSRAVCDSVVIESALTIKVLNDAGRVVSVGKLNGNRSLPTCDGGHSYFEPNDDASQATSTSVVAIENVSFSLEYK